MIYFREDIASLPIKTFDGTRTMDYRCSLTTYFLGYLAVAEDSTTKTFCQHAVSHHYNFQPDI